jgi:hypothetical protein
MARQWRAISLCGATPSSYLAATLKPPRIDSGHGPGVAGIAEDAAPTRLTV